MSTTVPFNTLVERVGSVVVEMILTTIFLNVSYNWYSNFFFFFFFFWGGGSPSQRRSRNMKSYHCRWRCTQKRLMKLYCKLNCVFCVGTRIFTKRILDAVRCWRSSKNSSIQTQLPQNVTVTIINYSCSCALETVKHHMPSHPVFRGNALIFNITILCLSQNKQKKCSQYSKSFVIMMNLLEIAHL